MTSDVRRRLVRQVAAVVAVAAAVVLGGSACTVGAGPSERAGPTVTTSGADARADDLGQRATDCDRVLSVYDEAAGHLPGRYVDVVEGAVLDDDQVAALSMLAEELGGLEVADPEVARAVRDLASVSKVLVQRSGEPITAAEADRYVGVEHVLVFECNLD